MSDAPKDEEAKFNETLKRMLNSPLKSHKKEKPDDKPALHGGGTSSSRHRPRRMG